MLEPLVRCHILRRAEVGFAFADRHAGESKGSLREGLNYLRSLSKLRCRPGTVAFRPAAAAPATEPLVPLPQEAEPG
jgi:dolichol-phosphate mannosyltransferase